MPRRPSFSAPRPITTKILDLAMPRSTSFLRMSKGAIIQRRCGPTELRVVASDPRAFRIETAFFIVEGDLSKGVVRQSLRFNDGRTIVAAQAYREYAAFSSRGTCAHDRRRKHDRGLCCRGTGG